MRGILPDDVFRGSVAVAERVLTPAQLRGPGVRRLFQDVYVPAGMRITHELRCRGATLALPAGAVVTGRSAATVRGVRLAWPEDDVTLLAPPAMRLGRRAGIDVRRTEIEAGTTQPWAYGLIAAPTRMVLDLLLDRRLPDAVADLDAVLRAGLVDRDVVTRLVAHRSDRGIVRARQAVALADPRAEALPESRMRVHLVLAGLDPLPQYEVRDATGRRAVFDLAIPARRVAVEYDGDWRDGQSWALNRDRDRLNWVQALGWTVVFVTAPLLRDVPRMIATVRAAVAAA